MTTSTQIIASAIHNFHEAYRDTFIPFDYDEDGFLDIANQINDGDCGLLIIALEPHLKKQGVKYQVMTNGSHWFILDDVTGLFHDAFIINGAEIHHITDSEDITVSTGFPKHLESRWCVKLNYIKPVLDVYLKDGDIDKLPCNLINGETLTKNRTLNLIPGTAFKTPEWSINHSLKWSLKQVPTPILGMMEVKNKTANTTAGLYKLSMGCVSSGTSIQVIVSSSPIKVPNDAEDTTAKKVIDWLSQNTRAGLFKQHNQFISRLMSIGIAEAFFGGLAWNAAEVKVATTAAGVNIFFKYGTMRVSLRVSHMAPLMGLVQLENRPSNLSELYNYNKDILCLATRLNLASVTGLNQEDFERDFFYTWTSPESAK